MNFTLIHSTLAWVVVCMLSGSVVGLWAMFAPERHVTRLINCCFAFYFLAVFIGVFGEK